MVYLRCVASVYRSDPAMTYRPHMLLTWGGRLGTVGESWSNSIRLTADGTDPSLLDQLARDQLESIDASIQGAIESGTLFYGNSAYHDFTKLNAIGPDGRYSNAGETRAIFHEGTEAARSPYDMGAFQLALCVSFTTSVTRGRAAAGRLYVPAMSPSAISDDNGQITTPNLDTTAQAWVSFLEDINDNPGWDIHQVRCAVHSKLGNPGAVNDITGVRIGKVLDTQRRRRASLDENYTATFPVSGQG